MEEIIQHCVLETANHVLCLIEDTHNHHQCEFSVIELWHFTTKNFYIMNFKYVILIQLRCAVTIGTIFRVPPTRVNEGKSMFYI